MKIKNTLGLTTFIALVYLVYYYSQTSYEVTIESTGREVDKIMMKGSGGMTTVMTGVGIHVVGFGKGLIENDHVGYIEDFNRIEKLTELSTKLKLMESKKYPYFGIVTNGGTHKKPALTRIRDDLSLEILGGQKNPGFSLQTFFKTYDMGKFLSVEHGCCKPYLLLMSSGKKRVEKIGKLYASLKHRIVL